LATWLSVSMRGFGGALGAGVRRTHFERRLSQEFVSTCAQFFSIWAAAYLVRLLGLVLELRGVRSWTPKFVGSSFAKRGGWKALGEELGAVGSTHRGPARNVNTTTANILLCK
jgi:hypothetical protein